MEKIFGLDWRDIQRAQQGGRLGRSVDVSKPIDHSLMPGDLELLAHHGKHRLREMQYFGVLGRLERNGY